MDRHVRTCQRCGVRGAAGEIVHAVCTSSRENASVTWLCRRCMDGLKKVWKDYMKKLID